mmetsp:Transcript_10572/g.28147  ORF Transcript_10572/g.28147 Transcript_10572/m.28147 type:complete len:381 (+) Transcript_10572:1096-2238(+)
MAFLVSDGGAVRVGVTRSPTASRSRARARSLTTDCAQSRRARWVCLAAANGTGRALIVSNKGGGHGELGYHLALALCDCGLGVTLLNDTGGDEAKTRKKVPFSKYGDLEQRDVSVVFSNLAETVDETLQGMPDRYDYIFDNQNVVCGEVAKFAASRGGAFYSYVSSGGMYIPGDVFPMPESNAAKDSNAQKQHEEFVLTSDIRSNLRGCAFFRPQYIVGPLTNKRDYLDWFFNRLTRGQTLAIPAPGTQTTTVTDACDVASMLASVVGKEDAIAAEEQEDARLGPVFNCASDVSVTLVEIAHACGRACGLSQQQIDELIVLHDPAEKPDGEKFPFRATNFDVGVGKAKRVLRWSPQHSSDFDALAKEYYAGYVALGLDKN